MQNFSLKIVIKTTAVRIGIKCLFVQEKVRYGEPTGK